MSAEQEIHSALGELVSLAEEVVFKPGCASPIYQDRLDKVIAELVAIVTAKPSRRPFCDCGKVLSICLRRLLVARQGGQADKVLNFESAVGFFLPFVKRDALDAMVWLREQSQS